AARTSEAMRTPDAAKSLAEFNRLAEQYGLRTSEDLKRLEGNRYFTDALARGVMYLFSTPDLAKYSTEGLRTTLESKAFIEALKTDGFVQFMEALRTPADFAVAKEIA